MPQSPLQTLTATPFHAATPSATPPPSPLASLTSKPFTSVPASPASSRTPDAGSAGDTYFQGKEPSGAFLGVSPDKDPYSQRPYFAYRGPGDTATTTDRTRTAPKMDPEVAAPTPRDSFENPRMPEGASQGVRAQMGATSQEQLDHRMALALGGSNDNSNLKPIPTAQNQAAGKGEGKMSSDVSKGHMSLFQAQNDEAKAKGLPAPWTDNQVKTVGFLDSVRDAPDDSTVGTLRNTVLGIPKAADTVGKSFGKFGAGIIKGITSMYTDPSSHELGMESQLPNIPVLKQVQQGVLRTVEPMVEPLSSDAAAAIILKNPAMYDRFVDLGSRGNFTGNADAQELLHSMGESAPQVVGDTAQAVLGAYMPTIVGGGAEIAGKEGIVQALKTASMQGAQAGLTFGVAQAASSGSKDPKEIGAILLKSTVAGTLLNMMLVGGAHGTGTSVATIADKMKPMVNDALEKLRSGEGERGFIANPFFKGEPALDAQNLHQAAMAHDEDFKSNVESVANEGGWDVKHGTVKNPDRIEEKAHTDYGGDVSQVSDANRSTILVDHPDEIHKVVQSVENKFGTVSRVKSSDAADPGYKKTIINVPTPHGADAEIQVTTPEMLQAKEAGGHDMYKQVRSKIGDWEKARAAMHQHYDDAHARTAARLDASPEDISWPSNSALRGAYGRPVDTTVPQTSLPSESTRTTAPESISKNRGNLEDIQADSSTKGVKGQVGIKGGKPTARPTGRATPRVEVSVPPEQESEIGQQMSEPRTESTQKPRIRQSVPVANAAKDRAGIRGTDGSLSSEKTPIAYDKSITDDNGGVEPPVNKGGMQTPQIAWPKGKDIAAIRLSTDTMERNVEKVFPPEEAAKINDFGIKAIRKNETDRASFVTNLYKEIQTKVVQGWGIRARSLESKLVQQLGEGSITIDHVRAAAPGKVEQIQKAVTYFRQKYDELWHLWNEARALHGLPPIGKIDNYFRHFPDFGSFLENFLPTNSTGKLPTAISGITDYFKSRTPWSSAAMRRTGEKTALDAVSGMQNYIEVASRAIFHTDSVQRGRLLEKYLRNAADATANNPDVTKRVNLPNFAANLNDWVNLVSGKQARLDRAIESVVGRPALSFMRSVIRRFGLNVIGGNVSAATTHSIPLVYTLATTDTASAFRGLMITLPKPFMADFSVIGGQKSSFLTRRFMMKNIDPTVGEKVGTAISKPFQWADEFISHFAVASKFEEGIAHGLSSEEAMAQADNYAARVIGDRSTGNLPNLMNTKTLGMITQFQIEVNDNLRVLMHDVPKWAGGNPARVGLALTKFAVYSYMFNQVMQTIKGSGKGLDPINMGLTLAGLNDAGAGKTSMERLQAFGGELAGELPFTSVLTQGQYPVLQGIPIADAMKGDWGTAIQKFASAFASPVGGGVQLMKSAQGINAWRAGVVTDASGKTITPIPQTLPTLFQGTLFGKSAFPSVRSSNTELANLSALSKVQQATSKAKNQQASQIWQQIKGIQQSQGDQAAKDQLTQVADQDPDMAQRVLTAMKNDQVGMTKADNIIKSLGVKNGQRAAYIKQQLNTFSTNDEKRQYLLDLSNKKILTADVLTQVLAP